MTPSLCSIADLKEVVDVGAGFEQFDDSLWRFSVAATSLIEQATRRSFGRETITEFHDTRNNYGYSIDLLGPNDNGFDGEADRLDVSPSTYKLRGFPIANDAPITVWYSPNRLYTDDALVAAKDYVLEGDKQRIILLFPTGPSARALKVSYEAGYALDYVTANEEYHSLIEDTVEVNSSMLLGGGIAAIFDSNTASTKAESASAADETGWVSVSYEEAQIVKQVKWSCPSDDTISAASNTTTFVLEGDVDESFSDPVLLATRSVRSIAPGETVTINNPSSVAYKAFRVTAVYPGAATTYCSECEFVLKDATKAFLVDVPDDLRNAGVLLAKYLFQKNRGSGFGMVSGSNNDVRFSTQASIPNDILQMVLPYRRFLRA